MEHRFVEIPHGWLAGAWSDGDEQYCKWEYDGANRLLFVDWADQFHIEAMDPDHLPETLEAELPKIALELANRLARRGPKRKARAALPLGKTLRHRLIG